MGCSAEGLPAWGTVSLGLSQHKLHGSEEDASACDCSVVDLSLSGVAAWLQHGAQAQADGSTCSPGRSLGICCGATDWTLWPTLRPQTRQPKGPYGDRSHHSPKHKLPAAWQTTQDLQCAPDRRVTELLPPRGTAGFLNREQSRDCDKSSSPAGEGCPAVF